MTWWGSAGSRVRSEDAPIILASHRGGIEDGMSWNINWERDTTASDQVSDEMTFEERDVRTEINRDGRPGVGERKLGKGDVMVLINREGRMIKGVEEMVKGSFNFRGVGNFTFDGWASHLNVIISRLVGEGAREGSL